MNNKKYEIKKYIYITIKLNIYIYIYITIKKLNEIKNYNLTIKKINKSK